MIAYLDLPPAIDGMLDALLATGLYGEDRNAAVTNLVLDQVKHLAGGRGPLAELLLEASRRAREAEAEPELHPPEPPRALVPCRCRHGSMGCMGQDALPSGTYCSDPPLAASARNLDDEIPF